MMISTGGGIPPLLNRAVLITLILQGVRASASLQEQEHDAAQDEPLVIATRPALQEAIDREAEEFPPVATPCSIELDPEGNSDAEEVKAALQCAKERQVTFCPLGGYGFNNSECWRDVYRYLTQTAQPPPTPIPPFPPGTPAPTAYPFPLDTPGPTAYP